MASSCSLCPSGGVSNICKAKILAFKVQEGVVRATLDKGGALGMRLTTKVKTIKILLGTRLSKQSQGVTGVCSDHLHMTD